VLSLARSTFYANVDKPAAKERFEAKYAHLKGSLREIIKANSGYGYRRIQTELKDDYQITINHKPLKTLLKLWGLQLKRQIKNPEKSGIQKILEFLGVKANLLKTLGNIQPFSLIYTDMTEINYAGGKLYLLVYLDHITKKILGHALSKHPDTALALKAFNQAKAAIRLELKRLESTPKEIMIHQDQGSIYTSYAYVDAVLKEDFTLSYSRPATPTDNPEMESWNGRFKTENSQLFLEAKTPEELTAIVDEQILYYNQKRRHSSLRNLSPINFINLLAPKY